MDEDEYRTTVSRSVTPRVTESYTPCNGELHIRNRYNLKGKKELKEPTNYKLAPDGAMPNTDVRRKSRDDKQGLLISKGNSPTVQKSSTDDKDGSKTPTGPTPKMDTKAPNTSSSSTRAPATGDLKTKAPNVKKQQGIEAAVAYAKARSEREREKKLQRERRREEKVRNTEGEEKRDKMGMLINRYQKLWWREIDEHLPDTPVTRWDSKQRRHAKKMLEKYETSAAFDSASYLIRNWSKIREIFFKGEGYGPPTIGLLISLHDSIVPMAIAWAKVKDVLEEWNRVHGDDPYAIPDEDLERRYNEAKRMLDEVGVIIG